MKTLNISCLSDFLQRDWVAQYAGRKIVVRAGKVTADFDMGFLEDFEREGLLALNSEGVYEIPCPKAAERLAQEQKILGPDGANPYRSGTTFNLTKQGELEASHPELAARLRAEAGSD